MANKPKVAYKRAPSEEFLKLMKCGGFLEPVIALNHREVCGSELDVHLRVDDEVHVYCGRTAIIKVRRLKKPKGYVTLEASETYKNQFCGHRIFGRWKIGDPGFAKAIEAYVNTVQVTPSFVKGEGAVQTKWSLAKDPWIPFDREAQFGNGSTEHREKSAVDAAFCDIKVKAEQGNWKDPEKGAKKLDQLAIDSKSRLVLLELKDGSKSNDQVYYVSFQLLQYVWEWHNALEEVQSDLQELINVRERVCLMPKSDLKLSGGIRAAVGFGHKIPTANTKKRYKEVLKIVNDHLPRSVPLIETWAWSEDGPYCLDW